MSASSRLDSVEFMAFLLGTTCRLNLDSTRTNLVVKTISLNARRNQLILTSPLLCTPGEGRRVLDSNLHARFPGRARSKPTGGPSMNDDCDDTSEPELTED